MGKNNARMLRINQQFIFIFSKVENIIFYVDLDYLLFSLCMEESTCTQRISANIKHDRVV